MHKTYDAIVVGARCAGSPTAMLLARKGYSGGVAFRIVKEELDREGADTEALYLDTDGLSGVE